MENLITREIVENFLAGDRKEISFENIHGEEIRVKQKNGRIFIHHDDCTKEYIPIEQLICLFHLEPVEWMGVIQASKLILFGEIEKKMKLKTKNS
jgi:hypothetical protein